MTTTAPKPAFNLNMHTHRLLSDEPFFAALSRRIDKRACTSIPTAAVRVTEDGRYEMVYNPDFMQRMVDECRNTKGNADNPYRWVRGILMHEFYHLIYGHLSTRKPEGGMTRLWNVAMDLAINTHIPDELPPLACIPGQGPFTEMDGGLTAEAYYKLLNDDQQPEDKDSEGSNDSSGEGEGDGEGDSIGGSGGSGGSEDSEGSSSGSGKYDDVDSMDDHSGWGESQGTTENIAEERLKDMVRKAAEEAGKKGWGSVSSEMRKTIMESITTKVDWRSVLRNFVKAVRSLLGVLPSSVLTGVSPTFTLASAPSVSPVWLSASTRAGLSAILCLQPSLPSLRALQSSPSSWLSPLILALTRTLYSLGRRARSAHGSALCAVEPALTLRPSSSTKATTMDTLCSPIWVLQSPFRAASSACG